MAIHFKTRKQIATRLEIKEESDVESVLDVINFLQTRY
jgi:hypothetical protein